MEREPSRLMRWLVAKALSRAVARAAGVRPAPIATPALEAFRALTLAAAQEASKGAKGAKEAALGPDAPAASERALFAEARRLGAAVRRALRVRDDAEAFAVLRFLYRCILIDVEREDSAAGEWTGVRFPSCYFAQAYDPATCAFMASFDSGFACGLTGGRGLAFSARLTEGAPCCRAALVAQETGGEAAPRREGPARVAGRV